MESRIKRIYKRENMKITIKSLDIKNDARGWLSEIIRAEDVDHKKFGQVLITTANPGETKGNHYHKRKTEWYCIIKGRGILTMINRNNEEKKEIKLGEKNMVLVKIPPNHFHYIKNIGKKEMLLLVYVDEVFNSSDPDTYRDN